MKKLFLGAILTLAMLCSPLSAFASIDSDNKSNDKKEKSTEIIESGNYLPSEEDNLKITTSPEGEINALGLIGGGVLECEGIDYIGGQCSISLISTEPISSGYLRVDYYQIESWGARTHYGHSSLSVYPEGSSYDVNRTFPKKTLVPGDYVAVAEGTLYTSYGETLYVSSLKSDKFTVK